MPAKRTNLVAVKLIGGPGDGLKAEVLPLAERYLYPLNALKTSVAVYRKNEDDEFVYAHGEDYKQPTD